MFRSKSTKEETAASHHSPLDTTNNDKDAFIEYARQSDLPPLEDWPTDTIVVPSRRGNVSYSTPGLSSSKHLRRLPTDGSVVNISSNLFEGKIITRVRDDNADEKYFRHRSRHYNWIVQGRFQKRLRFDDVITGQELKRAFRNAPSSQVVQRLLDMLKNKLPDSFECDFLADEPFFLHPLLAGCQHFRIDKVEGIEDEICGISSDGEVIEDTTLLNDDNIPQDGAGRRKFFSKSSNLCRYFFEPDLMYTFDFYSNFFSPTKFSLEMGPLLSVDLIPYFNGYPLFLSMAKDKSSGEYLWATELWHKRLLNYEETPGRFARWIG